MTSDTSLQDRDLAANVLDRITWDERLLTDNEFISAFDSKYGFQNDEAGRNRIVEHFRTRKTPAWFYDLRDADRETYCATRIASGTSDAIIAEADDLIANIFSLAGTQVDVGEDLDWHIRCLYEHTSTSLHFKRMRYLLVLADAYLLTGNEAYIAQYVQIVDRYLAEWPLVWQDRNPHAFRVQKDPVQEAMSTAFRTLVWLELLYTPVPYHEAVPVELTYRMIRSAWFTANQYRRFEYDEFTEANHHLFERGIAPFMFSVLLPEFTELARMGDWSKMVVAAHVENDFLDDGSYLEPSIAYTVAATLQLMYGKARVLGTLNNNELLDTSTAEKLDSAMNMMFRLIEPCGSFPPIGDDTRREPTMFVEWMSQGLFGGTVASRIVSELGLANNEVTDRTAPLPPTFGSFENAGFISDRENWSQESDYFLLSANTRGLWRHGHLDMLSMIVAAGGVTLIDEPAAAFYQFSHGAGSDGTVARGYIVNLSSHNTILAWGKPIEDDLCYSTDWNVLPPPVTIEASEATVTGSYIRASHAGYPSVRCTREALYVKAGGWIVRDEVGYRSPPPGYNHSQRWHFAEGSETRRVDDSSILVQKSSAGLLLVWPIDSGVTVNIERCHELSDYTATPPVRCTTTFCEYSRVERARSLPTALVPVDMTDDAADYRLKACDVRKRLLNPLLDRRINPAEDTIIFDRM